MYRETTVFAFCQNEINKGITPMYRETTSTASTRIYAINRITPMYRETTVIWITSCIWIVWNNPYVQGNDT